MIRFLPLLTGIVLLSSPTSGYPDEAEPPRDFGSLRKAVDFFGPRLLSDLQAKGIKVIGVLPFLLKETDKNGAPIKNDRAGAIHMHIATQLEASLIRHLSEGKHEKHGMRIIRRASATIEKAQQSNPQMSYSYLRAEGRDRLFELNYEPAWGDPIALQPDALIFGLMNFSEDLQSLNVTMFYLARSSKGVEPQPYFTFTVPVTSSLLASSGRSYATRTMNEADIDAALAEGPQRKKAIKEVSKTSTAGDKSLLEVLQKSSLGIEVKYNGKLAEPYVAANRLHLPEPETGQKVTIDLIRKPALGDTPVAVVVKINGLSSLNMETQPPASCRKWIIGKNYNEIPFTLEGFEMEQPGKPKNDLKPFVVTSLGQSIANEVRYGSEVGQIYIGVFRSAKDKIKEDPIEKDLKQEIPTEEFAKVVRKSTLSEAKAALSDFDTRGLIEAGETIEGGTTTRADFPNPQLVAEFVFSYYLPHGKTK